MERPAPAGQRLGWFYVAVAGLAAVGRNSEQHDLLRDLRNDPYRALNVANKALIVTDIVVAGKDGNRRVRRAPRQMQQAKQETGTGIAVARLHQDAARWQLPQLVPRKLEMVAIHDD